MNPSSLLGVTSSFFSAESRPDFLELPFLLLPLTFLVPSSSLSSSSSSPVFSSSSSFSSSS
ncbi:hypothetical protein ES288_A02G048800v1 [Gossypium darwinii]|nr:hypothetical protein ES288_A02G048800v1 [Gossypium darwinii]